MTKIIKNFNFFILTVVANSELLLLTDVSILLHVWERFLGVHKSRRRGLAQAPYR